MKILLIGKNGQVGHVLAQTLAPLGKLTALGRAEVDVTDLAALEAVIAHHAPDVLVNATAYTAVDKAESEAALAHRINAEAVGVMARAMAARGGWFIHYSTDYVFSGTGTTPWREADATAPLNVYGKSKLAGEQAVQAAGGKHLILRTSWVYGAHGHNFVKTMLRLGAERDHLRVVADQHGAPTSAEMIAEATAQIIQKIAGGLTAEAGIYHLAAAGETTWHGFAEYIFAVAGMRCAVEPIATKDYPTPARRPANSRLNCTKLQTQFSLTLPDWKWHAERVIHAILTKQAQHGNQS